MAGTPLERITDALKALGGSYYRLVLVVGAGGSGKTVALRELADTKGWPLLNLNLALSEQLIELTQRQRSLRVRRVLEEVVASNPADVLLLDNIELLFSPDLQQDPLKLLQSLSRNRTIVAAWPGEMSGDTLSYAVSGHPEHQRHHRPDAALVVLNQAATLPGSAEVEAASRQ